MSIVAARTKACVVAHAGVQQGRAEQGGHGPVRIALAPFQTISASPTQAEVTALRDCLVKAGLMKAE